MIFCAISYSIDYDLQDKTVCVSYRNVQIAFHVCVIITVISALPASIIRGVCSRAPPAGLRNSPYHYPARHSTHTVTTPDNNICPLLSAYADTGH